MKRLADTIVLVVLLTLLTSSSRSVAPPPVWRDQLSLLVVRESSDLTSLPGPKLIALQAIRDVAKDLGAECWIIDPDQDASGAPEWVREALRINRESLPWLIALNGGRWYSGPFPEDVPSLRSLLEGLQ